MLLHAQRLVVEGVQPLEVVSLAKLSLGVSRLFLLSLRHRLVSSCLWQYKPPRVLTVCFHLVQQDLLGCLECKGIERVLVGIEALLQACKLPLCRPLLDSFLIVLTHNLRSFYFCLLI